MINHKLVINNYDTKKNNDLSEIFKDNLDNYRSTVFISAHGLFLVPIKRKGRFSS